MALTNPDGRTHARTHIHRTKNVTAISCFTASRLNENLPIGLWFNIPSTYKIKKRWDHVQSLIQIEEAGDQT